MSRGEGSGITRFLRVGFIEERLAEIAEAGEYAQALLDLDAPGREKLLGRLAEQGMAADVEGEIRRALRAIVRLSRDTARFLSELPCQPLLYTGPESTDTVIRHLERLLEEKPVAADGPARQRRGA